MDDRLHGFPVVQGCLLHGLNIRIEANAADAFPMEFAKALFLGHHIRQ
jgi:hypothetical protein